MILGSHNSWSYLPPRHWWMRPFAFMARCQSKTIQEQYELGVRCFDLRVRTDRYAYPHVYHGSMEYKIFPTQLKRDLKFLHDKGDCFVRVIHEARTRSQYQPNYIRGFREFCAWAQATFPDIDFWCGRNLYNYKVDYDFSPVIPTCDENYSSVISPALDDWWPWLYARLNNKMILAKGTDKEILLIDFVNIK